MPSTSKKQHNFMAAVAHSPAFAKKVGVPKSVGQDFSNADRGRKFAKGGDDMATKKKMKFAGGGMMPSGAEIMDMIAGNRPNPNNYQMSDAISALKGQKSATPPRPVPENSPAPRVGLGGGRRGPPASASPTASPDLNPNNHRMLPTRTSSQPTMASTPPMASARPPMMKKGGVVKKYAKGGSIDGCAQRGKTRGAVR